MVVCSGRDLITFDEAVATQRGKAEDDAAEEVVGEGCLAGGSKV